MSYWCDYGSGRGDQRWHLTLVLLGFEMLHWHHSFIEFVRKCPVRKCLCAEESYAEKSCEEKSLCGRVFMRKCLVRKSLVRKSLLRKSLMRKSLCGRVLCGNVLEPSWPWSVFNKFLNQNWKMSRPCVFVIFLGWLTL